MGYKWQVAGLSEPGRVRTLNEDRYYFKYTQASDEEPTGLFLVADGMGGHLAGEVASHWATETLKREIAQIFKPRDPAATRQVQPCHLWQPTTDPAAPTQPVETEITRLISHGAQRANEVLLGYAQQKPHEAQGMGSTSVLAVIQDGLATVGNVGDSRAYLWRAGQLYQLTRDHTLPGELVARGLLKPDQVPLHPQRHILHRCLGRQVLLQADVYRPIKLEPGDRLLLCTDGLWEKVTPASYLSELIAQEPVAMTLCHKLVKSANDRGGDDNITVLVMYAED